MEDILKIRRNKAMEILEDDKSSDELKAYAKELLKVPLYRVASDGPNRQQRRAEAKKLKRFHKAMEKSKKFKKIQEELEKELNGEVATT